jgi:hypothetical protein
VDPGIAGEGERRTDVVIITTTTTIVTRSYTTAAAAAAAVLTATSTATVAAAGAQRGQPLVRTKFDNLSGVVTDALQAPTAQLQGIVCVGELQQGHGGLEGHLQAEVVLHDREEPVDRCMYARWGEGGREGGREGG